MKSREIHMQSYVWGIRQVSGHRQGDDQPYFGQLRTPNNHIKNKDC